MKNKLTKDDRQDLAHIIIEELLDLGCISYLSGTQHTLEDKVAEILKKEQLYKKKQRKLYSTDYVLYDVANDHLVCHETSGNIIIYNSHSEILRCKRGNEVVYSCTALPKHQQKKLLKQINKK